MTSDIPSCLYVSDSTIDFLRPRVLPITSQALNTLQAGDWLVDEGKGSCWKLFRVISSTTSLIKLSDKDHEYGLPIKTLHKTKHLAECDNAFHLHTKTWFHATHILPRASTYSLLAAHHTERAEFLKKYPLGYIPA